MSAARCSADASQPAKSSGASITGIRSCTCAQSSFGVVVTIVKVGCSAMVFGCHKPAKAIATLSVRIATYGCFAFWIDV